MTKEEFHKAIEMNHQLRYCGDMMAFLTHRGWIWEEEYNPIAQYLRNVYTTLDDDMRSALIGYYAKQLSRLQEEQVELFKDDK